jgi:hypothetical protein
MSFILTQCPQQKAEVAAGHHYYLDLDENNFLLLKSFILSEID